jgi:hypothetical protein
MSDTIEILNPTMDPSKRNLKEVVSMAKLLAKYSDQNELLKNFY